MDVQIALDNLRIHRLPGFPDCLEHIHYVVGEKPKGFDEACNLHMAFADARGEVASGVI